MANLRKFVISNIEEDLQSFVDELQDDLVIQKEYLIQNIISMDNKDENKAKVLEVELTHPNNTFSIKGSVYISIKAFMRITNYKEALTKFKNKTTSTISDKKKNRINNRSTRLYNSNIAVQIDNQINNTNNSNTLTVPFNNPLIINSNVIEVDKLYEIIIFYTNFKNENEANINLAKLIIGINIVNVEIVYSDKNKSHLADYIFVGFSSEEDQKDANTLINTTEDCNMVASIRGSKES